MKTKTFKLEFKVEFKVVDHIARQGVEYEACETTSLKSARKIGLERAARRTHGPTFGSLDLQGGMKWTLIAVGPADRP